MEVSITFLLFSFVSHLQESVVFSYKVELRLNIFKYVKTFSFFFFFLSENDMEAVGVNFVE